MQIIEATSPAHLASIRELFLEYANSLETDLCFQNFQQELADLPGIYAPPRGRLLLAVEAEPSKPQDDSLESTSHFELRNSNLERPSGCVGLRPLEGSICEMKRLYVRPAYRRQHLGRQLALAVISAARQAGYKAMRLDTLDSMKEAQALYRSLGFKIIEPYCHNPTPGVVFMELTLKPYQAS